MKSVFQSLLIFILLTLANIAILFADQFTFANSFFSKNLDPLLTLLLSTMIFLMVTVEYHKKRFIKNPLVYLVSLMLLVSLPFVLVFKTMPSYADQFLKMLLMQMIPVVVSGIWFVWKVKRNA
ncbi:hypothetical protein [Aureibacter tunicatorum]|uniref:ABC-type multidrug transport system permease subunit n=1 Tax=Aureibacter tunicatorum TaxID=866807 RepID=A0AAE4BRZ6_9BACT|nr:hypothetical protein [Aureibacter tunicatorum]MDR6237792.1 ABC-type multidrug transport system permease subunit [Aureibacter tunicatorum]BDD02827.1 hypothetical protein AUTU_03100 [Aureibacter tunicatorum]